MQKGPLRSPVLLCAYGHTCNQKWHNNPFAFGTDDHDGESFCGSAIHDETCSRDTGFEKFKVFITSHRKIIHINQVLRIVKSKISSPNYGLCLKSYFKN